jgi:hypothetical protein
MSRLLYIIAASLLAWCLWVSGGAALLWIAIGAAMFIGLCAGFALVQKHWK